MRTELKGGIPYTLWSPLFFGMQEAVSEGENIRAVVGGGGGYGEEGGDIVMLYTFSAQIDCSS